MIPDQQWGMSCEFSKNSRGRGGRGCQKRVSLYDEVQLQMILKEFLVHEDSIMRKRLVKLAFALVDSSGLASCATSNAWVVEKNSGAGREGQGR